MRKRSPVQLVNGALFILTPPYHIYVHDLKPTAYIAYILVYIIYVVHLICTLAGATRIASMLRNFHPVLRRAPHEMHAH